MVTEDLTFNVVSMGWDQQKFYWSEFCKYERRTINSGHNFEEIFSIETRKNDRGIANQSVGSTEILF